MNANNIMEYMAMALLIIGVLAFLTSVIVQTIKEMPYLKDVPTSLVALVVAEIITVLALFTGCQYFTVIIMWYYVTSAIIAGFIVYLVATGGWEKLKEIWDRTKYKGNKKV